MEDSADGWRARESAFPPTHWSIVLGAGAADPARAKEALERLCCLYRGPIVKWFRRYTRTEQDAEDLAHDFLVHLLTKELLARLKEPHGKFRSFLVTCMVHFLHDSWDKAKAQKRGGGATIEPLNENSDCALDEGTDSLFDVDLALDIDHRVMKKIDPPPDLLPYIFQKDSTTRWDDVARKLQTTATALRQRVRRLRQEHWKRFADEAGALVSPPGEADETRYLYELLFRNPRP